MMTRDELAEMLDCWMGGAMILALLHAGAALAIIIIVSLFFGALLIAFLAEHGRKN